jgi:hypothetical protein
VIVQPYSGSTGGYPTGFDGTNADCAPGLRGNKCDRDIINGVAFKWAVVGCQPGWKGDNCESRIAECDPNPCKNGGLCMESDTSAAYKCECAFNFEGPTCETYVCGDNPAWTWYNSEYEQDHCESYDKPALTYKDEGYYVNMASRSTCSKHGASISTACPKTCHSCPDAPFCTDTCKDFFRDQSGLRSFKANNGKCEDGGPNSEISSGSPKCGYGTDCADCGPRSHTLASGEVYSQVAGQSIDEDTSNLFAGLGLGLGVGLCVALLGFIVLFLVMRMKGSKSPAANGGGGRTFDRMAPSVQM